MSDAQDAQRLVLRVVHGGEPTPEQIAALVVAIEARAAAPADSPQPSAWSDRAVALRRPLPRGPAAWRASGRAPGVRTRAGT